MYFEVGEAQHAERWNTVYEDQRPCPWTLQKNHEQIESEDLKNIQWRKRSEFKFKKPI